MAATDTTGGSFAHTLRQCAAARYSGVLRVDGQPGGVLHLTNGGIAACETSGAPSLEVILLRSRRISESDWEAAFTAAAVGGRPMTAELVQRGLLGAGEAEALLRTALADAMFALVSGQIDGCTEAPSADCLLPLTPAAKSGWLLAEATRRGQVLASFSAPVISARDRVAAAPGPVRPARGPGRGEDEVLALADGRRTVRDLAFALGRGVYETMLLLARMRAANAVVIGSPGREPDGAADVPPDGEESDRTVAGLPRRRKDRPNPPRTAEATRRNLMAIRMLRPRAEGNPAPGGA